MSEKSKAFSQFIVKLCPVTANYRDDSTLPGDILFYACLCCRSVKNRGVSSSKTVKTVMRQEALGLMLQITAKKLGSHPGRKEHEEYKAA
ncbi:hypothetical protein [Infirmifilum sp. SLHALR2]